VAVTEFNLGFDIGQSF